MRSIRFLMVTCAAVWAIPAAASEAHAEADSETAANTGEDRDIIVLGQRERREVLSKADTPPLKTPQPITIITDDIFEAQGAVSISDTLNYVSGVQANPYGPDSRVDGAFIRGINALQFRDGMRDIFSYYASIRADPYNFSQVEVVRGPASVLYGAGSLGGTVNLSSKIPQQTFGGVVSVRYGSFDRKELLADVTGPITKGVAGRIVARVRAADTQTNHVADDRLMVSPSLTFAPGPDTHFTLIGLYQEDDGGSTSQFLPLVGTILSNPNGKLDHDLFIGKPGWDRYDGRLLQGTAILDHQFSDLVSLNAKARYIDSDLTYLTHYPDNYSNPANPYLDPEQRLIGLYSDGSQARMEVFSTDNNLRFSFNTGARIEHSLLAGVDYSWNRVRKVGGFGYEVIDIYDPDYDAISDHGGGLPQPEFEADDTKQDQLGFYLQDQILIHDRVTVVLGLRRDRTSTRSFDGPKQTDKATTFRAGVIGEVIPGVSPFVSYTESFEPIAGTASNGNPFVPKRGRQFEAGIKFHPSDTTLVTVTAYHIKEQNTPIDDPDTPDPFDQTQAGSLTSKGFEIEGRTNLPGNTQLIVNYSYNSAQIDGTGQQLENVPKHNASIWGTKRFAVAGEAALLIGGGVRYVGSNKSFGPAFPDGVKTPSYTLVDAIAELSWHRWSFAVNAVNLLDKRYYSACLARGDCFQGQERNIFGTLSYRF